jgi:UDP-N-acetylglucosamine 2-epimerase (non-hydrolysing)
MIAIVAGTTGELIKLAPLMLRLQGRYVLATTAQQATQIEPLLGEFGLTQPDIWLARGARGRDLESNRDIPGWLATVLSGFARHRGRLRAARLVVVHGDTMTTLLGTLMGRRWTFPTASSASPACTATSSSTTACCSRGRSSGCATRHTRSCSSTIR